MSEKAFKKLLFSAICIMAIVTITGCDKDNSGTSENGGTGGSITSAGYVDLGLPSGTKWKTVNETNRNDEYGFYTYDDAIVAFGDKLPTKEQFMELGNYCEWTWNGGMGYKIVGPNGKSISLPAAGSRGCNGDVGSLGSCGVYWSSSPLGSDGWVLYFQFETGYVAVDYDRRCGGHSVRLVEK